MSRHSTIAAPTHRAIAHRRSTLARCRMRSGAMRGLTREAPAQAGVPAPRTATPPTAAWPPTHTIAQSFSLRAGSAVGGLSARNRASGCRLGGASRWASAAFLEMRAVAVVRDLRGLPPPPHPMTSPWLRRNRRRRGANAPRTGPAMRPPLAHPSPNAGKPRRWHRCRMWQCLRLMR